MRATSPLDAIGNTPLVEISRLRPEGGARIFLKWEGANPTGSMKDRMALAMIRGAEREGLLKPGQRVVEYTGGSTGSSLALVCAAKGYPLTAVTADCFAKEKIDTMRAFGADVEVLKTPEGKVYPGLFARFEERAREIVQKTGAYWTHQMSNPHQLEGYGAMGDEILGDCPGVTDFVMAVGTAGCAMGNAQALRQSKPDIRVTLVEPEEAAFLSKGVKGSHRVEGIALSIRPPLLDDRLYDDVLAVPEEEGRSCARRLARDEGILAGASSGLNVAAAIRVASGLSPDEAVVTVAIDSGLKYLNGDLFRPAVS